MKDKGKFVLQFVISILIGAMVCGTVSASTYANEGVNKLIDVQNDANPNYSPNGKEIVFSSAAYSDHNANQASIWIMDLSSGNLNKVNIPGSVAKIILLPF